MVLGGCSATNIDRKSCTRSAAAIPVTSACVPWFSLGIRFMDGDLTAVIRWCNLHDVGAARRQRALEDMYVHEKRSLHKIEASETPDNTFELTHGPSSGFWSAGYTKIVIL